MHILACEGLWALLVTVICFDPSADVEKNVVVLQASAAADERGVTAEHDKVLWFPFGKLVEQHSIGFPPRLRRLIRIETVAQHLARENVMNTLPVLAGHDQPRGDEQKWQEYERGQPDKCYEWHEQEQQQGHAQCAVSQCPRT
jgi:hypothetical protein